MNRTTITLIILILLTIISAIISNAAENYVVLGILMLAGLKFIGVSFYFMELKKANAFWKISVLIFLTLFLTSVSIIIHN